MSQYTKIIHQIWYDLGKGPEVPEKYQEYQKTWQQHNPQWQYILWNEAMGDLLMQTHYPEYYQMYKEAEYPIMKIDILRYCILDTYGGLYADIDYKCLTNFDNYLQKNNYQLYLNEQPNQAYNFLFGKSVSNSLIIATQPKNPFWKILLAECANRIKNYNKSYHIYYVIKTTGPGLVNETLKKVEQDNPELYKTIKLLPFSQFNFCNDCNKCSPAKDQPLYAVHDYVSYWNSDFWLNFRKIFSCYPIINYLPIVLIVILLVYIIYKVIGYR